MYDEESKVITSIVSLNGEDKEIVITEQLVREVLDFPDDENSPTKFPERMVKGWMLRMDPDPVDHQKWRNDKEIKERSAAYELAKLTDFKETRTEWFLKEEKKKRSRKTTPKVQVEEGSSSQPKKRQKKVVEKLLVDEPEEEEPVADAEGDHVRLSPESEQLLKSLKESFEAEKAAGENEGDNEEKSSSSSSESEIDKTERLKRIKLNPKHASKPKQPTPPEYQPSPPHQSPPYESPPKQTSPPPPHQQQQSPPHSLSQIHSSTPTHEQPVITSQHILQTPPTTQPQVQTTPGSSGFKDFPRVPENIGLEDIGDFSFVNDELVKKLQQKVDDVLVENKKLIDREKKLEKRVKTVEAENSSLLKRVEADQADIDILKVRIAELEEEKARRDEQNEYFKLKNKELEATNAKKEHEMYMMNKVLENLIGKPVEQRFEEIEVEEVRARRKAEIEADMKNKGKGIQVEGVSEVTERAIVPSIVHESPIQNPCSISAVSDDVFSASSHDDDDDGNDDDQENAECEGEHVDDKGVDESENLILRLEPDVEEGEYIHSYTLAEIIKLTHIDESTFKFDFEEELNEFDINQ
ncbi:inner centromere protein A-like [Helianthus annuus]|uniref:inner centromere protein A-like n=1 Tax=Helianthus annuus TaxID=4232 RepID=UPI000B901961|nr:inner centromere protein A-like [Helianthus annuus]